MLHAFINSLVQIKMLIDLTSLLNLGRIDINQCIMDSVISNEDKILLLNKEQMDKGTGSDDQDFGDYKKFKYKDRFKPIDLKLTGDFRDSERIEATRGYLLFVDQNYKTPFLNKRFGSILGLTDQNIDRTAQLILPDVIINLENQLT